jgi:hypothetical protein
MPCAQMMKNAIKALPKLWAACAHVCDLRIDCPPLQLLIKQILPLELSLRTGCTSFNVEEQ